MNRLAIRAGLVAALTCACVSDAPTESIEPTWQSPEAPASSKEDVLHRRFQWNGAAIGYLDFEYVDSKRAMRTPGRSEEAVILVHGWAASTRAWTPVLGQLARRCRVLCIDLPGHGSSGPPTGDYSMALFADAVAATLDDAGVKRAVVVGHSNGTPVALNFYRRHPQRTLAIVAVDGALKSPMTPEQAEVMFAPLREANWQEIMVAFVDSMKSPRLSDDQMEAIRDMALDTPHEAVVGGFDAAVDPYAWSDEPIDVPLLALLAQQPIWDAEYESWVRERVTDLDYQVWEDIGHYMQLEKPEEVCAAIVAFLDERGLLLRGLER